MTAIASFPGNGFVPVWMGECGSIPASRPGLRNQFVGLMSADRRLLTTAIAPKTSMGEMEIFRHSTSLSVSKYAWPTQ